MDKDGPDMPDLRYFSKRLQDIIKESFGKTLYNQTLKLPELSNQEHAFFHEERVSINIERENYNAALYHIQRLMHYKEKLILKNHCK